MKKIQNFIRNYFGFSQKETNGFIILAVLMLLLIFTPYAYDKFNEKEDVVNVRDQYLLDSLAEIIDQNMKDPVYASTKTVARDVRYFDFDPNLISQAQWKQLGIDSRLGSRIRNYCAKGGKFKVKKDLLKIYGFPESQYQKLATYILLPDTLGKKVFQIKSYTSTLEKKPVRALLNFDINLADTTEFKRIKGIGSKLSVRIIKYRDKLGGFVKMDQVKEVYGLDSLVIEELMNHSYIDDKFEVNKININTISYTDLSAHPYFQKRLANAIINYRTQHKSFQSLEELKNIKIITDADIQKIKDYILF